jgi:hypothetical protein
MHQMKQFNYIFVLLVISFVTFSSCNSSDVEETSKESTNIDLEEVKGKYLNLSGEYFAIPSPFQISIVLKEANVPYNSSMLSSVKDVSKYSTTFQKAFNLGVLGADLGYVTLNDQSQDALQYLAGIKKIADELGISSAFDQQLMKRYETNIENIDSVLVLVSDAYRLSDDYLKNNARNDLSSLVLTGGWIESLYFATKIAQESSNEAIKKRIVEQKNTVESIIKLLFPFAGENQQVRTLTEMMIDLNNEFKQIDIRYQYVEPEHDAENKMTKINSKTTIDFTQERLQTINTKIENIRNKFIN